MRDAADYGCLILGLLNSSWQFYVMPKPNWWLVALGLVLFGITLKNMRRRYVLSEVKDGVN